MPLLACNLSAQEITLVEIAPPTRICEEGEPELIITNPNYEWQFHGWNANDLWTFSTYSATGFELDYGWIDATNPLDIFLSSYSFDGEHFEIQATQDNAAQTITIVAVLETPLGTTSATTTVFTSLQIQEMVDGFVIDECEQNLAIASSGQENPWAIAAAIAAPVIYGLKVNACIRDTNTQWRFGKTGCNNAFPPGTSNNADCLACVEEKALEDRGNCLILNGPDGDYRDCVTVITDRPQPSGCGCGGVLGGRIYCEDHDPH